ncbi:hypothetical protein [Variovorax sp. J22R115]|uniref:hypothetical protein n=1 Tax=Variovorax sp. J22R115 TaxID=3053509 RepID=UPI0025777EEA|nr:hypothetical protein [Variovorax sp. J22R115]
MTRAPSMGPGNGEYDADTVRKSKEADETGTSEAGKGTARATRCRPYWSRVTLSFYVRQ